MNTTKETRFKTPSFPERIKSMLGVDLYRLFHTPMLYIFLAIAAIIPAMVSAMTTMPDQNGELLEPMYTNVWQIIAANTPLYVVRDIADYANMNMVFIFGGIMVSIFIGHDYSSGYVKQLFTTHSKKQDYMISKTITCSVAMALMCLTYLIGGAAGGILADYSLEVNVPSLILAVLGKIIMILGWSSLFTFINILFRKSFGMSILSSFFFGTGILIIGFAAICDTLSLPQAFLNIFLYGSSVNACLESNILTLVICIAVSLFWTVVYNVIGTRILSKCDVY